MHKLDDYGPAFLAMHLHMLRKLVSNQSDRLFEDAGIVIPSQCASVVLYLDENKRASIADLADALGYSHQLINQRIDIMLDLGMAKKSRDTRDRRKMVISLTRKGALQANRLNRVLPLAAEAMRNLFDDVGVDLVEALLDARARLADLPLSARIASVS